MTIHTHFSVSNIFWLDQSDKNIMSDWIITMSNKYFKYASKHGLNINQFLSETKVKFHVQTGPQTWQNGQDGERNGPSTQILCCQLLPLYEEGLKSPSEVHQEYEADRNHQERP